jgi:LysM repeat protein
MLLFPVIRFGKLLKIRRNCTSNCRANKLDPSVYLYVGQKLIFPSVALPEQPVKTTYVVVSGDTLWKITQKFGVTTQAIIDANKLDPNTYLYVGQTLIIPSKP